MDDLALVTGVVLGEDQLCPELLDDPMREIVVLEQVYLLTHFALVKMAVETAKTVLYISRLFDYLGLEPLAFFGLHEVDDFFRAYFGIIDEEGIFHGVLLYEIYDFYPFDVVLLVY